MSELRRHPYRPKLISLKDEIRLLRRMSEAAKQAIHAGKPTTIPADFLLSFDQLADYLAEESPEESAADQDLPRYGMYL